MAWLLILMTQAAFASPFAPVDPARLEQVPDVRLRYYDVRGTTSAALHADQRRRRPVAPSDGRRWDALTTGTIRWRRPVVRSGRCDVQRADIRYHVIVTLPRLHDRAAVAPVLRRRWDRFVARLRTHEAGHVAIGLGYFRWMRAVMRAARCPMIGSALDALNDRLRRATRGYDRITDHGLRQDRWRGGASA